MFYYTSINFFFYNYLFCTFLKLPVLAAAPDIFHIYQHLLYITYLILNTGSISSIIGWLLIYSCHIYALHTLFFTRTHHFLCCCYRHPFFYILHIIHLPYSLKILSSLQLQTYNYTTNALSHYFSFYYFYYFSSIFLTMYIQYLISNNAIFI